MKTSETAVHKHHALWGGLTAACVVALVLAPVFSNQSDIVLQTLGRIAHLTSLGLALTLICLTYGTRSLALLLPILVLFAIGTFGFRSFYLQLIYILLILAALCAAASAPKRIEQPLIVLVALCAVLMFLQVLGVGEWTQYFATHGIVNDSYSIPKVPMATLLLGYYEVQANFLQGRPAGIFHANQFASFVILATMAIVFSNNDGKAAAWKDGILCIAGVLSLSKAVTLGIFLFGVYLFFQGPDGRRRAYRIVGFYILGLMAYAILFPGMFQIYFFNFYTFIKSILVRVSYLLVHTGGFSEDRVTELVSWILSLIGRQGMTLDTALREIMMSAGGGQSLYSEVLRFVPVISFAALFILVLAIISNRFWHGFMAAIRHMFDRRQVLMLMALGTTGVAMNYSELPLFWFFVGLAVPRSVSFAPAANSDDSA